MGGGASERSDVGKGLQEGRLQALGKARGLRLVVRF